MRTKPLRTLHKRRHIRRVHPIAAPEVIGGLTMRAGWYFNPPPNWPRPSSPNWRPPKGWEPDPAWGPAPDDWTFMAWSPTTGWDLWERPVAIAIIGALLWGGFSAQSEDSGSAEYTSSLETATAPVPTATRAPMKTAALDPIFRTCAEVKQAGYGPYYRGRDAEYRFYTDRDHDGIVCE